MRRELFICLLLVMFTCSLLTASEYEPYEQMEFPDWAIDLRRAETIFFGSLPITFTAVNLSMGIYSSLSGDSSDKTGLTIALTAAASSAIALIDYLIGASGVQE